MTSTSRVLLGRRWHRATRSLAVIALTVVSVVSVASAASPATELPEIEARGAFGVVSGQPLPVGASRMDPSTLAVLDTYARGTTLAFRPVEGTLGDWSLSAVREPDGEIDLGTGSGPARATLDQTGMFLLHLDATVHPTDGADPVTGTWAWRVAVPDRDLPDGEDTVPPPRLQLASGDQRADLEPGSGCFLGTCGDIGGVPPVDELPTIRTIAGAPIALQLGDSSAFTSWSVEATPADDPDAEPGLVIRSDEGVPATRIMFAAPGVGAWRVLVNVTFDRDRGSFDGYGRLVLSAGEPAS